MVQGVPQILGVADLDPGDPGTVSANNIRQNQRAATSGRPRMAVVRMIRRYFFFFFDARKCLRHPPQRFSPLSPRAAAMAFLSPDAATNP